MATEANGGYQLGNVANVAQGEPLMAAEPNLLADTYQLREDKEQDPLQPEHRRLSRERIFPNSRPGPARRARSPTPPTGRPAPPAPRRPPPPRGRHWPPHRPPRFALPPPRQMQCPQPTHPSPQPRSPPRRKPRRLPPHLRTKSPQSKATGARRPPGQHQW